MATYGKYEVIVYPSGYAVTNMQTHEWMHEKLITDYDAAHRVARRLQKRDAEYPAPPADPYPVEPGDVPADG